MAIFEGSRYEFAPTYRVITPEGAITPAVYQNPRIGVRYFAFWDYVVQDGDTFEVLAWRFLNDTERWWEVALANPEISYPDDLSSGVVVRIPSGS